MKSLIERYSHVAKDFSLNILASLVITAVTQIMVYPWLAREYDAVLYGVILTIMGVGNTLVTTVGVSLNNTRLLMVSDYEEAGQLGDFLPLLNALNLVSMVLFFTYIRNVNSNINNLTVVLLLVYIVLGNARGYGMVAYRLILNFRKNLICSIFVAMGNISGVLLVVFLQQKALWPIIFVLGEGFGITILLINTSIFNEPLKRTTLFSKTSGKLSILLATTLIGNLLIYLDRILLLPILGGEAVSTYTTASFFGKCLGLLLTPMAGVLLSYYAQGDYAMTKKKFRGINVTVLLFAILFFLVSLLLSAPLTGLLYPTLIAAAKPFLMIANITMIIASVGNMTQPAVLKYAPTWFQIVIQLVYCIIYVGGGYIGSVKNGLQGFAIAALLAALFRLFMLYGIGETYIGNSKK